MKSLLLKYIMAFFLFGLVTTAKAQIKRPHLLLGANVSYFNPQGSFADKYKFGAGGEIS